MRTAADFPVFSRPLRADEFRDGASGTLTATAAELTEMARLLDLVVIEEFAFAYRLMIAGEGRLRLSGRLNAKLAQTCVVSLDPLAATLDLPVEIDFWPSALLDSLERSTEDTGSLHDWPEPIVHGTIDPGPVLYEVLATSLEPYPKREGASFEWSQPALSAGESQGTGPFAALKALKPR
jgi:hypothetical protein